MVFSQANCELWPFGMFLLPVQSILGDAYFFSSRKKTADGLPHFFQGLFRENPFSDDFWTALVVPKRICEQRHNRGGSTPGRPVKDANRQDFFQVDIHDFATRDF